MAGYLSSERVFLVALEQGFLLGRVIADEAELLTVAVRPEAQGQGIGNRLVAAFLAEAAKRGAAQAFLEVAETNSAARALYSRAGFAETGRRKGYYSTVGGPSVDAILMSRAVVPLAPVG